MKFDADKQRCEIYTSLGKLTIQPEEGGKWIEILPKLHKRVSADAIYNHMFNSRPTEFILYRTPQIREGRLS